ncbi:MAG: transcriptional repressor [Elusimicrobiota bacterium]|jgi:Fur family peroxide stress response transcriptional regulator|nr:transcriptional repressor [Elusimicrobiota bacterium]
MDALKYSRQREAIKNFLMTRRDHPDANTIYQNLKLEYPSISLGTVYRNLSILANLGEISKLSCVDGVEHFDGYTKPHYHLVCKKCNKIIDLDFPKTYIELIVKVATAKFKGKIEGHMLYFDGFCEECNLKNKSKRYK